MLLTAPHLCRGSGCRPCLLKLNVRRFGSSRDQTHRRKRDGIATCRLPDLEVLASTQPPSEVTQRHSVVVAQALAEALVKY